jgi:transcriptional regulator with GAF, ATPase, and Fis domain
LKNGGFRMDNRKIRVLVFEDEPNRFRILVEGIFTDRTRQEREIRWSRDGIELKDENEKFIKKMEDNDLLEGEVDLILVDIKMGPETPKYGKYGGILILERIFGLRNHCRSVVATSGYIDDIKKDHPDAQKAVEELEQKEDLIIIDRKITQANANDYALLRQIIASRKGRNLLTPQIERQILLLGRTNDPVLILGATGTGKEGIATSIHKAWCEHTHNGEKRPFLSLNAGALQYDLMRSELFGYAQGAYTGALQTGAVGIAFQSCGIKEWKELKGKDSLPGSTNFQGTLFFDEIGNTDLGCQVSCFVS